MLPGNVRAILAKSGFSRDALLAEGAQLLAGRGE
jgi:hypothetical protein